MNNSSRLEALITSNNTTFEEHRAALQKVVADFQRAGIDGSRISMALEGTKELNESSQKMRADFEAYAIELKNQMESAKASSTTQIEAVKTEASDWAEKFKVNMFGLLEAGAGLGKSGGKGGGKDQQKSPTADRKEVAVWKLSEHVSKQEFRHWVDTIFTNLDAAHGFKYPEIVLDKVKRLEVEVNDGN